MMSCTGPQERNDTREEFERAVKNVGVMAADVRKHSGTSIPMRLTRSVPGPRTCFIRQERICVQAPLRSGRTRQAAIGNERPTKQSRHFAVTQGGPA